MILNGDRHETVMTERSGLFSVYCGCGWKAQDLTVEAAEDAEAQHTQPQPSGQSDRSVTSNLGPRAGDPRTRPSRTSHVLRTCATGDSTGIDKRITPHSLRHTFITLALDAGASVRDVQHSVGHRDARQVAYYDRNRASLPRNSTHIVSAYVEGS